MLRILGMSQSASQNEPGSGRAKAEKWLRRRIVQEGIFRAVEGLIIGLCGLLMLCALCLVVLFFLVVIPFNLWLLCNRGVAFPMLPVILMGGFIFFAVMTLITLGARRNPWEYYDDMFSESGLNTFDAIFGRRGMAHRVLFYSGPAMLIHALDSLATAARLFKLDVPEVTAVILWLWDRGRKASVKEVSTRFPHFNAVKILPQLRDIPGVVWLPNAIGIIILSQDFRQTLAAILGLKETSQRGEPPPKARPEPPHEPPPASAEPPDEASGWYCTLGLPPYAPMHLVKQKYRQLVKQYHPDLQVQNGQNNEELIKRINIAYHNIVKAASSN